MRGSRADEAGPEAGMAAAQNGLVPVATSEEGQGVGREARKVRAGGLSEAGGVEAARAMLGHASLGEVAEFWRENFQELMRLDQRGAKQKRRDMARGRVHDHVPSSIAPLLAGTAC